MNLIIMGAPGAGKGTQAEVIGEKWKIPTISTGEIFRDEIQKQTDVGILAKSYIDKGNLVPDDITIQIVKEYLTSDLCENGFILDGFPRSLRQAQALDELGIRIDAVLSLEVPDDAIVARMGGRRLCKECGASYHIKYNPPQQRDVCDKCGGDLYIRSDDAPDTVLVRLKNYHAMTEPIKAYYEKKGLLIKVVGQEQIEETKARVLSALQRFDL